MNKKQWTGLLMIYVSYLFLGATIFYSIESGGEELSRSHAIENYAKIKKTIQEHIKPTEQSDFVSQIADYCDKPLDLNKSYEELAPKIWNYYNSFFFVVTVVSTIGYGNLHPTTDLGRVIMIIYAVVGIPLNGILLTSLGQFFGEVFLKAHKRYKNHERYGTRFSLTIDILTYLVPGFVVFIFLPAGVFVYFEDWDYIESVYYAFVTLTTIGFGDLVAGQTQNSEQYSYGALITYKTLLICWVIFGLGYLIMLLGFVAQAMNSKKILKLEQKLMASVTHSRVWHGFSKDIGFLKRVMNELYIDKLKPVFRDEFDEAPQIIHRSKSLPDLIYTPEEDEDNFINRRRARALSENTHGLTRMFSETDLQRIDKNATFAAAAAIPSTFQIMKKVIDVYSGGQARNWSDNNDSISLQGVEGFSDEDVLASEKWQEDNTSIFQSYRKPSTTFFLPSYEDTVSRQPHRGRAMSECPQPELNPTSPSAEKTFIPVDWTWSGPAANKLHDIIKQRNKQRLLMNLNGERKGSLKPSNPMMHTERKGSLTASIISGAKRINPLGNRKRRVTDDSREIENELEAIGDANKTQAKASLMVPTDIRRKRRSLQENSHPKDIARDSHYLTTTAATGQQDTTAAELLQMYSRGDRLFSDNNGRELLEETSIADFLRALTSLHSRVGESLINVEDELQKPRRKMGTASLNPPKRSPLFDLFGDTPPPPPTPRFPKKRKQSKIANLFRTDSKKETTGADSDDLTEKPVEHSNLKRLGRFLLRSYSIAPKDLEDPSVPKPVSRRKRFSLWPSESDDKELPVVLVDEPSPEKPAEAITVRIQMEPDPIGDIAKNSLPVTTATFHLENAPSRTPTVPRKLSHGRWQPENPLGDVTETKETQESP